MWVGRARVDRAHRCPPLHDQAVVREALDYTGVTPHRLLSCVPGQCDALLIGVSKYVAMIREDNDLVEIARDDENMAEGLGLMLR